MSKIPITKRWQLDESDSNYPKNDTAYKTKKCTNRWPCKFQGTGKCLFWHHEYERDYWDYVRKTAKKRQLQPAEIDKEIKTQRNLAVGSELPKKQKEVRGTSPFEYGLGGRKKRKSLFKKKRTKKVKKRRRKRRTKKRKSRKRRRTKRKKK